MLLHSSVHSSNIFLLYCALQFSPSHSYEDQNLGILMKNLLKDVSFIHMCRVTGEFMDVDEPSSKRLAMIWLLRKKMFVQRYPPIYRPSLNTRRVLQCQSSTTVKWLWVVSLHANLWRWEMKIGSTSASKLIRLLLAQIQEGGLEVSTIRNLFLEINWSMIYIGYPCIINYFLCKLV